MGHSSSTSFDGNKPGPGRPKGSVNKVTAEIRKAFRLVFEDRLADLNRWIVETGDGFITQHVDKDGEVIGLLEKNPGKAAELLVRLAEFHFPKLARIQVALEEISDEELLSEMLRRESVNGSIKPGSPDSPAPSHIQ